MAEQTAFGGKPIVIALVMLIVVGSVMMFVVMEAWNTINPNPYEVPRTYTFEGEMNGEPCTGEGVMTFKNESEVWHVYSLDYTLSTATVSEKHHFGVLFNASDIPDPDLYEYLGTKTVEGMELGLWKGEDSGIGYVMYVGDKCSIIQLDIVSEGLNIIGHRVS